MVRRKTPQALSGVSNGAILMEKHQIFKEILLRYLYKSVMKIDISKSVNKSVNRDSLKNVFHKKWIPIKKCQSKSVIRYHLPSVQRFKGARTAEAVKCPSV